MPKHLGHVPKHWLYVTVIRPTIACVSVVRWNKNQQRMTQVKLTTIQIQDCLAITGAIDTTPTATIGFPLWPSLHIHLESGPLRLYNVARESPLACVMMKTSLLRYIKTMTLWNLDITSNTKLQPTLQVIFQT